MVLGSVGFEGQSGQWNLSSLAESLSPVGDQGFKQASQVTAHKPPGNLAKMWVQTRRHKQGLEFCIHRKLLSLSRASRPFV